ncbi:6354_t:CDS:2 [Diversispora eburnea]|uniref:6354_t:CDS:1 n=1 Tax=Diversispora eburnea TaxID=1213867 RepID=A0A9N9FMX9_9GLOM|nr:6354_t:CDS:2 [Diversispora eburnea]
MSSKLHRFSFLEIVKKCDSFPYPEEEVEEKYKTTTPFLLSNVKIGSLLSPTKQALIRYNNERNENPRPFIIEENFITFSSHINTFEQRTNIIKQLFDTWREEKTFLALEDPNGPYKMAFVIERAATPLFGVLTFGVHLNGYIKTVDGNYKMWIAQRSKTKQTWPGYLDNFVAGGVPYELSISESVIKEAMEEASLPEEISKKAIPTGAITYFTVTKNGLQPEAQYVYDIELPVDVIPKPHDDEVECFYLWDIDEVIDHIRAGEFKPNCASVVIDFLIRHSLILPDEEPEYLDILYRLHRRIELPGPS